MSNSKAQKLVLATLVFIMLACSTHKSNAKDRPQDIIPSKETVDTLILTNESAPQIFDLLQHMTEKTILMEKNLPQVKISFNSMGTISKEDAIIGLKNSLKMNGIALIPEGENYLKAIPIIKVKSSAPPFVGKKEKVPVATQAFYSKMFELKYLTPKEVNPIIYPTLTPTAASLVSFEKANMLLVTDAASNIQRVERILEEIDRPSKIRERPFFVKLENASASEVLRKVNTIQSGLLRKYLQGSTVFDADERTNQIIVVTHPDNMHFIEDFIKNIDKEVTPLIKSAVIRINHGDAEEIVKLIENIIKTQTEKLKSKEQADQAIAASKYISKSEKGKLLGGSSESAMFSKNTAIAADKRSNAIVVYGTGSDIKQITELIGELDIALPQVRIEVIIAEVKLAKNQVSGIDSFTYAFGTRTTDKDGNASTGPGGRLQHIASQVTKITGADKSPISLSPLTLNDFSLNVALEAAKSNNNITVLATPTILTTHNKEATVNITETRPFIKATANKLDTASSTEPGVTRSEVDYKDAGLVLTVKPLIGKNGVVQMEINQKVNSFSTSQTKVNDVFLPHITKREAKSFITIRDKDVVILAGLKNKDKTLSKKKMFLLGDLPIIGDAFFTGENIKNEITELVIFIKPHVIINPYSANVHSKEYLETLETNAKDDLENFMESGKIHLPDEKIEEVFSIKNKRNQTIFNRKCNCN